MDEEIDVQEVLFSNIPSTITPINKEVAINTFKENISILSKKLGKNITPEVEHALNVLKANFVLHLRLGKKKNPLEDSEFRNRVVKLQKLVSKSLAVDLKSAGKVAWKESHLRKVEELVRYLKSKGVFGGKILELVETLRNSIESEKEDKTLALEAEIAVELGKKIARFSVMQSLAQNIKSFNLSEELEEDFLELVKMLREDEYEQFDERATEMELLFKFLSQREILPRAIQKDFLQLMIKEYKRGKIFPEAEETISAIINDAVSTYETRMAMRKAQASASRRPIPRREIVEMAEETLRKIKKGFEEYIIIE